MQRANDEYCVLELNPRFGGDIRFLMRQREYAQGNHRVAEEK